MGTGSEIFINIIVPARGTAVFLLVISRMVLRLEHGFIIDAEVETNCLQSVIGS